MRTNGADGVLIVVLAALGVDLAQDLAVRGADHAPRDLVAVGDPELLAVGGEVEAVGVLAELLAPDDFFGGEVHGEEVVFDVGGEVEQSQGDARADAFVSASAGEVDAAKELVTVVDVVDADAGLVGDVEAALEGAWGGQEGKSQQG